MHLNSIFHSHLSIYFKCTCDIVLFPFDIFALHGMPYMCTICTTGLGSGQPLTLWHHFPESALHNELALSPGPSLCGRREGLGDKAGN